MSAAYTGTAFVCYVWMISLSANASFRASLLATANLPDAITLAAASLAAAVPYVWDLLNKHSVRAYILRTVVSGWLARGTFNHQYAAGSPAVRNSGEMFVALPFLRSLFLSATAFQPVLAPAVGTSRDLPAMMTHGMVLVVVVVVVNFVRKDYWGSN